MELKLRIYTLKNNFTDSRSILINEGELDEVLEKYLKDQYLRDGETLVSINYEGVNI